MAKVREFSFLVTSGSYSGNKNHQLDVIPFVDLYEGLKRAQRSRLEDQRGTEINFELPDFLKVN